MLRIRRTPGSKLGRGPPGVEGAGDFERSIRDGMCWSVVDRRGRWFGVENSVESIVRDELAVGGGGGASLSCKAWR